jgi:dTMP kinase
MYKGKRMKQVQRGVLIAIEGIDGSGKSTLASNITKSLLAASWPSLLTKEPGDSILGAHIRSILHDPAIPKTPKAEFLLFASDRAQHMATIVLPALERKQIVISDRMADSSVVYQGYTRGIDIAMIKKINAWTMEDREPDIILYVRVSADIAYERLIKRNVPLTSFEQEPRSFFQHLVEGFDIVMQEKHQAIILDGAQTPEQLTVTAMEKILSWIHNNNRNQ